MATTGNPLLQAVQLERRWEREHPAGGVIYLDRLHLVLWNYAVGETSLKAEHRKALYTFCADNFRLIRDGATVQVQGHASQSGEEASNLELSRQRAEAVGMFFLISVEPKGLFRTSHLFLSGVGESDKNNPSPSGKELAQERRVEIRLLPATEEPEEVEQPRLLSTPSTSSPLSPAAPAKTMSMVAISVPLSLGPIRMQTPYGLLVYGFEVTVIQAELGDVSGPARARFDIRPIQRDIQMHLETLTNSLSVSISSDGLQLALKVGDDIVIQPQLNLSDPEWPTFTISMQVPTIPPENLPPFTLEGIHYRLRGLSIRGILIPNHKVLDPLRAAGTRVAARVAPWLRGFSNPSAAAGLALPLAYVGFVLYGADKLSQEQERGREIARIANVRRGYARALVDVARGFPVTLDSVTGSSRLRTEQNSLLFGASLALSGWENVTPADKNALKQWIMQVGSLNAIQAVASSLSKGRTISDEIPHPQTVIQELTTAGKTPR